MPSGDVKAAGLADAVAGGAELLDLRFLKASDGAELELWITVEDLGVWLDRSMMVRKGPGRVLTAPATSCAKLPPCLEA